MPVRFAITLVTVKGAIMALILETILTPSFVQAVLVATCSATVSGVFLLIATHMNTRRTARPVEQVRRVLEDRLDGNGDTVDRIEA